jgi:hypothetical protein
VPTIGTAVRGNASATVSWTPGAANGSPITGFTLRVINAANAQVGVLRPAPAGATSLVVTGLTNGTAYRFQVRATNAIGTSAYSALSTAVTPATVPGTPTALAVGGAVGGAVTASVTWTAPAANGSPITGYMVVTLRMSSAAANATVVSTTTSAVLPATPRTFTATGLVNGVTYRFQVIAVNAVGNGPTSARSNAVTAR